MEDATHQGLEGSRNYTVRLQPHWQLWQNHRQGKKKSPKQIMTVVRKARRLPCYLSNISSGGGSALASHQLGTSTGRAQGKEPAGAKEREDAS